MAAWTTEEEQRRKRRKRILSGLLIGGAAVGVPALVNALVSRRARKVEPESWGRRHRYAWDLGDVLFQRLGQGEPVVLLHSFGPGHDSFEWRAAAERLAGDFQVFAPDLPGWGRSDRPAIDYDAELYIDFLIDYANDVVRRRAVWIASGITAAYAVQLAVDRPELVRALGLVCPLGLETAADEPDLKDAVIHRLLRLPIFGTSALNVYSSRRGIEHHLREEVFADPAMATPERIDHYWRGAHENGSRGALAAYLAGYLNHAVAGELDRLHAPLLLVWGEQAAQPPVGAADLWRHAVPDAELEVLADAGTQPHAEQPESFAEAVTRFHRDLPPA
ncbi:MAG: alpha/beta fold hydrolase [Acidobacteria bacterium]|nr:alpha/beta fold hydrolase [Acidobacteriota bacterium]MCB9378595.1 alpha/beta fold hydrolase [Holophagales bacterium]